MINNYMCIGILNSQDRGLRAGKLVPHGFREILSHGTLRNAPRNPRVPGNPDWVMIIIIVMTDRMNNLIQ